VLLKFSRERWMHVIYIGKLLQEKNKKKVLWWENNVPIRGRPHEATSECDPS
jgi:hypothetical protein